ncbi:hypothetical protein N7455_005400 [Penicillium solitum]|uniref:uncharacterized protein n=1 Tax=Penicillium solitum TaxID=60172 RepID=UPI0032C45AAB|nr:hypothetical protein N7455_005400 [Penicillium solitum]
MYIHVNHIIQVLYKMTIIATLLLGVYTTTALAAKPPGIDADADAEAEPECGALGVMKFDPANLPEGVTPADVRKCADHPLGHLAYPGADDTFRR